MIPHRRLSCGGCPFGGTIRRHSRALEWLADKRRPKTQWRQIGQQEPEARDIPVIMHIRDSEVKTREVELERRETELKDRQAVMLTRLDEREKYYTLRDLSPIY